jgi:nitronate monooxygenase
MAREVTALPYIIDGGCIQVGSIVHTQLCDRLGIDLPIFAAPMGFVTGQELAAAISNAGGLGIMSFSGSPSALLRDEIRRLRSLTNKPFGVNVLLSGPHLPFPIEALVDVCLDERVPVLSTFWGEPEGARQILAQLAKPD